MGVSVFRYSVNWAVFVVVPAGNIQEEFYIGNEYMHILTETPKMLRIELEAFSGEKLSLDYANFSVGPESDSYRMKVGNYLGNNMRYYCSRSYFTRPLLLRDRRCRLATKSKMHVFTMLSLRSSVFPSHLRPVAAPTPPKQVFSLSERHRKIHGCTSQQAK